MRRLPFLLFALFLIVAACGDETGGEPETSTGPPPSETAPTSSTTTSTATSTTSADASGEQRYPDIVEVEAELEGGGTYRFVVTVSSPYDSPSRYADAWRVLTDDGTVLGVRELTHDHANEQPFTRSLGGVEIPGGIVTVTIEGRDLVNGWGGETVEVSLPIP